MSRGGFDFTRRESMGVVAAIVPWNFLFPIACWKAAPALAAGQLRVLKPAFVVLLTALALGEIAHAAGLPPGVLQILPPAPAPRWAMPWSRTRSFAGVLHRSTEIDAASWELASRDPEAGVARTRWQVAQYRLCGPDWEKAAMPRP